jgi:hypothetical protein
MQFVFRVLWLTEQNGKMTAIKIGPTQKRKQLEQDLNKYFFISSIEKWIHRTDAGEETALPSNVGRTATKRIRIKSAQFSLSLCKHL